MALFGAAEDVLVEAERDQREIPGDPCVLGQEDAVAVG
jgi:hypothetical protein